MEKNKYAIVVSASPGYVPGVNAQLNAMWYYKNDVDFHLIYSDFPRKGEVYETFIDEIKADDFFGPRFFPIDMQSLIDDGYPQPPTNPNKTWRFKFYRYLYAVDRLKDYDAVAIFDADMTIVNNIMAYFDITASTGRVLAAKNDSTYYEYDNFTAGYPFMAPAHAPLTPPYFFDPKKFAELDMFNRLPAISARYVISDMSSFNNALIETSEMGNVIVLPGALWTFINLYFTPLFLRNMNGKRYLALSENGDRLFSFHRKFWLGDKCRQHITRKSGLARDVAYHNIRIFWAMIRLLNLKCRHRIAWDPSWRGFPDDLENIHPVSNTPCYPQP